MKPVRVLILLCGLTAILAAQPSLRITSPADGTVVHPGDTLIVVVDVSPPTGTFQLVFVVGFDPIGFSKEALNAPPYRFTLNIPRSISPRKYPLTASGFTSPGHPVSSDPIVIAVEREDSPLEISVYPIVADFIMDQKRYLQVTGRYADGTEADLTQSSQISYVSSAPGIATVGPQGIVTPVAPGSARITITYRNLKLEVPVRVRGSQR